MSDSNEKYYNCMAEISDLYHGTEDIGDPDVIAILKKHFDPQMVQDAELGADLRAIVGRKRMMPTLRTEIIQCEDDTSGKDIFIVNGRIIERTLDAVVAAARKAVEKPTETARKAAEEFYNQYPSPVRNDWNKGKFIKYLSEIIARHYAVAGSPLTEEREREIREPFIDNPDGDFKKWNYIWMVCALQETLSALDHARASRAPEQIVDSELVEMEVARLCGVIREAFPAQMVRDAELGADIRELAILDNKRGFATIISSGGDSWFINNKPFDTLNEAIKETVAAARKAVENG